MTNTKNNNNSSNKDEDEEEDEDEDEFFQPNPISSNLSTTSRPYKTNLERHASKST